ncbi:hypothetical protein D3C78_1468340 [compost metagenome]
MSLQVTCRCGIADNLALLIEQVHLNAGIHRHQLTEQVLHRLRVQPVLPQQRVAVGNVLRQITGQPLDHRLAVLGAAAHLHPAGDGAADYHQQGEDQGQTLR